MSDADQTESPSDERAVYLYGIAPHDAGLEAALASQKGIEDSGPPRLLGSGDLKAIVGMVSLDAFRRIESEGDVDLAWVGTRVQEHEAVLQAALDMGPVLPARFGALYRSEGELAEALERHRPELTVEIDRLRGKKEWGVQVFCDDEALRARAEESVADGPGEGTLGAGTAYLLRKRAERSVEERMAALQETWGRECQERLASMAEDSTTGGLGATAPGQSGRMILNASYLVDDDRLDGFGEALRSLEATFEPMGFRFRLTGPWPPHSFAFVRLGSLQS
jgi:hypothetical protein